MELKVRSALINELSKFQDLGFDYPVQAIRAILTHADWSERWDCTDAEASTLRSLASQYRSMKGAK